MFVLRRVLNDAYVSNTIVGDTYSIYFKEENPEDFNLIVKINKFEYIADRIFAFIRDSNGKEHPLYKNSRYYMMTSNGNTFEGIKER